MSVDLTEPKKIHWVVLDPPERKRKYHYSITEVLIVENVSKIEVRPSGTHRLECSDGRKLFVSPGWLWIELDVDNWTV